MKQLLIALVMFLGTLPAAAAGELKPYSGAPLPDFTLADLGGKQHTLSALKGQVVMVNFWATYCTPCIKEMPSMQRLNDQLRGKPFQILAIDMAEERTEVDAFLRRFKLDVKFPILLDSEGEVVEAWMVSAVPTTFIIDPQGTIRYALYGAIEWDSAEVVGVVNGLLK
ncbi:MAG TPA: TlpA disulfide reductase family protein [Gammaproteobacteria bacterium]